MHLGPYEALLFDMDGTILTSIAAVERAWGAWAKRVGLSAGTVLDFMHGRRALDTIRHFLPDASPTICAAEAAWLEAFELEDLGGIAEIPGAGAFLTALPAARWAVVTSATRRLALKRIAMAGLPLPKVLVSADDVARGKPDPAGYLLAAGHLRVDPAQCLVFEDAPAGIAAGLSAGAHVMVVEGNPHPDAPRGHASIRNYRALELTVAEGIALTLR